MIRVLHIIDHLGLGGAQTALLDMLKCRDQAAFQVEVAVMHGRGPFVGELEAMGVAVYSLSQSKWPPAYIPAFLKLIAAGKYDLLHFHLPGANWIAKPLAALAGHPVRIAHDHTSGELKFRGWTSLLPDAVANRFSTRVIAVSAGVVDFLARWEGVSPDVIEMIPNGVNTEEFRPADARERGAARVKWSVAPDAFVVGGIGRLAFEKNFILLQELARRHPKATFVLAGAGPERERIEAAGDGLANRVRLLGPITDRQAYYQMLDIFLLPSHYEGLPMAVLEAMAAGVPVLSSRLEGISAALAEEQEGLLAEPGNLEDFSRKLQRLEASGDLRSRLAASARNKVTAAFSAAGCAGRIEAVYRQELAIANVPVADNGSA
jgi:glycosyltransferase involved in cell wall biosynthesis